MPAGLKKAVQRPRPVGTGSSAFADNDARGTLRSPHERSDMRGRPGCRASARSSGLLEVDAAIRDRTGRQIDARRARPDRGCHAQQCFARLPLRGWIQLLEKLHAACRQHGNGKAIPVKQAIAGQRRQPRPGSKNSNQIERICAGDRQPFACTLLPPNLSQRDDCLRQGELLAGKAGNEPAAANFPAAFQLAIDPQQIPPGRQPVGLSFHEAPEYDPVALQQRARDMLSGAVIGPGCGR